MGDAMTPRQRAIIDYMNKNHVVWIEHYPGDVGTDRRHSGYYFQSRAAGKPPLRVNSVRSLVKKGYLEEIDGGLRPTQKARNLK